MTNPLDAMPVAPGGWLGLLGGGQLGRMFCHAAQELGYRVAVLDPDQDCPAAQVANLHLCAAYDDLDGLARLADLCAAVTTEFENVPAQSLRWLAERTRISPCAQAVATVQDRLAEKRFIADAGIAVAPYAAILTAADLDNAPSSLFPGILKLARMGYDGKGQTRVATREQAHAAFAEAGGAPCALEAMLQLDHEISVVMARGFDGATAFFPIARNVHHDGILAVTTVAQGQTCPSIAAAAIGAAKRIAEGLDYHGVLCVEFFVLEDGTLLVNEIAPRPHNSGHYTIDACVSSQFDQQARVLAGLPLAGTDLLAPAVMLNLLGDLWYDPDSQTRREPDWGAVLAVAAAKLHLYGKGDARPGRKMGHITCVAVQWQDACAAARQVAMALGLPQPR